MSVHRTPEQQKVVDQALQKFALYHFQGCPYCVRVRRAMARLNIDVPLKDIRLDRQAYDELVEGGGRKTVPCLRIEEDGHSTWLYESRDIIQYLDRQFGPNDGMHR
ncbi:glutaredoxin family protein [Halomonas binhaiensis]|uniref:Glutathione S-transferase N-terminal domain-containing protein n=1 Tax=Halomonas binhaiensis TaxID=2562282 RepID=A0A856QPX7_9GAMM|nr:glutathione S-transferase N-terminal domain-containing protein [Halomonas binhaiensis]QEM81926.2 glutathione S-transferase N-terminal domain-containing protein [Halomonas binhaiensis]